MQDKPAEPHVTGGKRRVADEDYIHRTVEASVGERRAANSSTHSKHDGFSEATGRHWVRTSMSNMYRSAWRTFAEFDSNAGYALHMSQDATRLGKPAKDTVYSLLVKVRGDSRVCCLGPPQVVVQITFYA